ncbi:cobalamin biosynthesis protein [Variovorax sp. PCZ-1]|uniref:cobalamin biosynthesis protein n=1 Tax=Variovorax sp. PCZ-1 TaxID=2835533 RepID=UPI001BCD09EB|nr:cobalamin biosynthesis protein [Variovorax sp. PCZ-1]MBS7806413.1 cobalamin biosynthesis protein [Variovorax sp. PCZ-1]
MSFFAILFALLIEQVRPMPLESAVHRSAFSWVRSCARSLDAGRVHHGWLLWSCAVLLPALLAWGVYALLLLGGGWVGAVLAFAWSVAVLYCTLGFRQFSHHFSAIRQALDEGNTAQAAQLLAAWKQVDVSQISPDQLTRQLMEHAVIAAHRHVFAVLLWYAVLAALGLGPAGAVLYRMAEFVSRYFHTDNQDELYGSVYHSLEPKPRSTIAKGLSSPSSQQAAQTAWHVMDYVPARATAMAFAVVGNFEEVVEAWRNRPPSDNDGVIQMAMAASLGLGDTALPEHLRSIVGLVWRAVVLWLLLIALLTLARLLG